MKHFLVLLAAAAVMPDLNQLKQITARHAPVTLKYDEASLSAGDRKALPKLVEAARVLNLIFMDQVWSGNRALYAKLQKDTTPLGKARLHYFWLNKGPWSDLDEHSAFVPGVPARKPMGANFYPDDMTREEFEAWVKTLSPADKEQAIGFFTAYPARPSTQRARLSHLRTVLGLHADTSGDAKLQFSAALLQRFKLPNDADSPLYDKPRKRREKKALRSEEVYDELHRHWATPELTSRNRAIIGLLFYAGLRRSEICNLRWNDINLMEDTIAIRGAKKRAADHVDYVPLLSAAKAYLLKWRAYCSDERQVVFCAISKSGKLLGDKPMSGEKIRLICGAEFAPHDARRTLGTRSIENGTPTNYTQKILRHASATQTLKYAEYIETKELGDKVKLGY